ncbi:hypothetical protein ACFLU3_01725 [Chloroflexota bacterium]
MINSVEEYLNQLRKELEGCNPAIIADAISATEEHLRMALGADTDLESVIAKYGSPEEVAAGYRELEGRPPTPSNPVQPDEGNHDSSIFKGKTLKSIPTVAVSAGKSTASLVWIIIGAIAVLVSLGLVLGGGALIWADGELTDDDGYYMTDTLRMDRNSYAIISEPAEVELGLSRAFDWGKLATFKIEAEDSNPASSIFIGVARETDVTEYLGNVTHDVIVDFEIEGTDLEYDLFQGTHQPTPPIGQTFWTQSVYGSGVQTLEWELETGTWVFVIMNEDGSADIDANTEIGAKVPWLFDIGMVLLICGMVGLIIGALVIFLAARKRSGTGANVPVAGS